jgi:hypothetical protein
MTQEAIVLRRAVKTLSIVITFLAVLVLAGGVAYAQQCSYFGCDPAQGNPIRELAGMVVTMGIIAAVLYGAAKRWVE